MGEQISVMFGRGKGIQKILSILLLQPDTNPCFLISLITSSTLKPVASKKGGGGGNPLDYGGYKKSAIGVFILGGLRWLN